ncbi:transposase [Actinomadura rudentiformis]|uniref:transposase n=1 Tax=Actinomadura rudentiformis TaxID=359158 RepID=UPI0021F4BBFF|nr:transposase [Actinomadura rudentiformis]
MILHNTLDIADVVRQLQVEGWKIGPEDLAEVSLNPYRTAAAGCRRPARHLHQRPHDPRLGPGHPLPLIHLTQLAGSAPGQAPAADSHLAAGATGQEVAAHPLVTAH